MSSWLKEIASNALHYADDFSGGMIYPPHREGDTGEINDACELRTPETLIVSYVQYQHQLTLLKFEDRLIYMIISRSQHLEQCPV
jgi:hypothetical protein